MEYLQIISGEAIQVTTHGNVEWDSTHYCPAAALTPEEAAHFNVHPLYPFEPPQFNPITQTVQRDGCEYVNDRWQYKWRIDDLTAEQIAANQAAKAIADREAAKQARQAAVEAITVTTTAGNTFDGDETSQTRMSRAILVLTTGYAPTVPWVLADNTVIQADVAELTEALALAGAAQAQLWVLS